MNQACIHRLKVRLADAIAQWIDNNSTTPEWEDVAFVHDSLAGHMADAAMAVFIANTETQDFLEGEGLIRNSSILEK